MKKYTTSLFRITSYNVCYTKLLRVDKLILSSTTSPDADLAAKYQQELSIIADLPEEIIREGAKQRFYAIVAGLSSRTADLSNPLTS